MNRIKIWTGVFGMLALAGTALGSVNVDSAANYSGGWTNGANGCGGFGAWSLAADSGAGSVYSDGWVTNDNGGFGFGNWRLTK